MKKKLWVKLFISVAVIFAAFVVIIAIANSALLSHYFTLKEEQLLILASKEMADTDISDKESVTARMTEINKEYNFDIEIYEPGGRIIYTTIGTQMMDFLHSGFDRPDISMNHEPLEVKKQKIRDDGLTLETAVSKFRGEEFLLCKREANGVITEIRIGTELLHNSAEVASEFITIIAFICLGISLVWVFFFAKRFTAPISEMSEITESMAKLDFSRRVTAQRSDEIGQLADSVNGLSDKLDEALSSLRSANSRLTDEIEAERRLDVMRRAFVANVSHELKTPLSIISGYAEGLKFNVNSSSKDYYCDTIIDETERMNSLVLSILELSKYESGQMPVKEEIFDISALAEDMARKIMSSRPDVILELGLPKSTTVWADPLQVEQIFKSYLENAAVHTKEGGKVSIELEDMGDRCKVKVSNEGERIDPEIMPDIWQSFWRADKSHSREEGRFGLGLSIVSAIVKNTGNSCGVYNTGSGVSFWFTVKKNYKA